MKIKIQDNSIRLRLTKSEVVEFHQSGKVMRKVQFPGQKELKYGLAKTSSHLITASFLNDSLTLEIPKELGDAWASTEQIGLEGSIAVENGRQLQLVVEKDLQCASRDWEDKSDLFPNPLGQDES
ncbi:MAG: DUF7009 family protein [Cyclobacteriaceae bacterium]